MASETFGGAAQPLYADAINGAVGLDMAIRRRVVDRDLERRVLSGREARGDDEGERGLDEPKEGRGGQKAHECKTPSSSRSSECDLRVITR